MSKASSFLISGLWLLLLVPFVFGQSETQDKPLGDLAREQRMLREHQREGGKSAKVVTSNELETAVPKTEGEDRTPAASAITSRETKPTSTERTSESQSAEGKGKQAERQTKEPSDNPEESTEDAVVVPVGTELRVDMGSRRVAVPVRVGFVTAIPALSKVEVQVTRTCMTIPYINGSPAYDNVPYGTTPTFISSSCVDDATVTALTIGEKRYEVQTKTLTLPLSGGNTEVTFVLDKLLAVLR